MVDVLLQKMNGAVAEQEKGAAWMLRFEAERKVPILERMGHDGFVQRPQKSAGAARLGRVVDGRQSGCITRAGAEPGPIATAVPRGGPTVVAAHVAVLARPHF